VASSGTALSTLEFHLRFEGFATILVGAVQGARNPRPVHGGVLASAFDLALVLP